MSVCYLVTPVLLFSSVQTPCLRPSRGVMHGAVTPGWSLKGGRPGRAGSGRDAPPLGAASPQTEL